MEGSDILFVQGLSNIPAIAEYFENDNYEEDVNEDNPMGMKGEIARAFGQLIKAGFPVFNQFSNIFIENNDKTTLLVTFI